MSEALFLIDDVLLLALAVRNEWYFHNPNGADRCNHCWKEQRPTAHEPWCPVLIAEAITVGYEARVKQLESGEPQKPEENE